MATNARTCSCTPLSACHTRTECAECFYLLRCSPAGGTLFEPQITQAAAARRHAKWKKAVQRSFALADLTQDLEEDNEQRQPCAAAEAAAGGGS